MSNRDSDTELQNLIGGGKKHRSCCYRHSCLCGSILCIILVLSASVVILGPLFEPTLNKKVEDAIADQVKLVPGSVATDEFISPSVPLYTTYFFFNITNPHEVAKLGAKPILHQLGPYTFREDRTCFNLEWLDDKTVLRYDTNITYTWDKDKSMGNDPNKDYVTTVNVPLIGVFRTVESLDSKIADDIFKAIDKLKDLLKWDGLFINGRTVSDLLWGYKDPLLEKIQDFHKIIKYFPDLNPVFAFSNKSTVETPNRVYTGVENISSVGEYIEWNGNTNISAWGNPYASMINGTSGYSFNPGITRNQSLVAFIDELYRSGYFTYNSDVVNHGIKLYKFTMPDSELLNTTQKEAGFPSDNPSGVLSLAPVVPHNIPFYASKPHFLHADPMFQQNVSGLNPDPSIHDSYVGVEPVTGAVMMAAKRIQLSIKLDRSKKIPELNKLRDSTFIPIYYAVQEAEITTSLANKFISTVYTVEYGIIGGIWAIVGLAGLVGVVSVMCLGGLIVQRCRVKKNESSYRRFREYSSTNNDVVES